MKTFYSIFKSLLSITALSVLAITAKADNNGPLTLNFSSVPVYVSGLPLQVGSIYKFTNITAGTDVLVTIVNATGGATVNMLDDNTLTKPEAFSPQISIPANSTGMVEFRFDFINGGGNPKHMSQFFATAMDIDGNSTLHEMDAINMGPGAVLSYLTSQMEISVVQNGSEYLGTNVAGIEYTGVDTSAKQVMFSVANNNISSFTYRAGANNQNGSSITRQKGIYFKGFDYAAALPVKYRSFTASSSDNIVNLNWITENEINNSYFELERSFDAVYFKTIATVANGTNSGNSSKTYQFKDNSKALETASTVYYRLKQVDKDGRFTYSEVLVVKLQMAAADKMQVSPNPFTESLTVRFTAATKGTAHVQILTAGGQKVLMQQLNIAKGNNSIQVGGISNLAPGFYIAQLVVDGNIAEAQKIIKK
jgi:Secretion system C-terminal sorting domain